MLISGEGLLDVSTGVLVGNYAKKGKIFQHKNIILDVSKEECRAVDTDKWGWVQMFNTQTLNEPVL